MKPIYFEKSLGLDIREESVALVLIGRSLRSVDILEGKIFSIPPLAPGNEKSEKIFLQTINTVLIEHDIWPQNTVVCLPRKLYTVQSFELPAPDAKSAHAMVPFELERHHSSGLDTMYYSYHIQSLGRKRQHVVSAAIKKKLADHYLQLIHRLGLKPSILDLSTFASANLILNGQKDAGNKLEVIVDLCSDTLDITLLKAGRVEFSRGLPLADPDISNIFFKKDIPQEAYESLSQGLAEVVIEEIQKALAACRTLDDAETVGHLHLAMGGPFAPYLARYLGARSGVPTSRVALPQGVNPVAGKPYSGATLCTALGLGLRELRRSRIEINALPKEYLPKRKKINLKTSVALLATAALLLLTLFVGQMIKNKRTLAQLDQQLTEVKGQTGALEKIDLKYQSLNEHFKRLQAIDRSHPLKLPILAELTSALPPDTWLTHIEIKKNIVEIKGYSAAASRLISLLEKSALFMEAEFMGTILNERGKEKFTIRTRIEVAS